MGMHHHLAKPVTFRGEVLTRTELVRRYKLSWKLVRRLIVCGELRERWLERHLEWRAERELIRALAARHGVPLPVLRMREQRWGDSVRAATTPVARSKWNGVASG